MSLTEKSKNKNVSLFRKLFAKIFVKNFDPVRCVHCLMAMRACRCAWYKDAKRWGEEGVYYRYGQMRRANTFTVPDGIMLVMDERYVDSLIPVRVRT